MSLPRTSVEQWAVLAAVVDEGGFAQAAAALNRSQSAVSYAVARLQEALDVPLLAIEGRKAVLTAHGQVLLKRARSLIVDLGTLETAGAHAAPGLGARAATRCGRRVSARSPAEHRRGAAAALPEHSNAAFGCGAVRSGGSDSGWGRGCRGDYPGSFRSSRGLASRRHFRRRRAIQTTRFSAWIIR